MTLVERWGGWRREPFTRDSTSRVSVWCLGETADGQEGDALVPLIQRARFACPQLERVGADQGFAGERVWKDVAALGVIAFVAPQRTMLRAGEEPTTGAKREALAARQRCKTPAGIWAHMRRMCDAEGGVAELKNEHGMDRARCRGSGLFHVQLLLGCTAINAKRLASRGETASGQAAGPATAQTAVDEGAREASGADLAARDDLDRDLTARLAIVAATRATWTITLSMN